MPPRVSWQNEAKLTFSVAFFGAHEPTLTGANSMSNKFSQTPRANHNHQHISKNKLTGGYRKRSSGSRAIKQNVDFFPDFLFAILTASTPRLGRILLGRKSKPSLQATCCHRGDARAQRAAPGRADFLELALRRTPVRPTCCHFSICEPCNFCAREPTLVGTNSM